MSVSIIQSPLYRMLATDEEIIFVVADTTTVATKFKVKFIAEVYVGQSSANIFTQTKAATLKSTPNNAGSGIFDFSRILEAYVSPDYLGGFTVTAGGADHYSKCNLINYDLVPHSIHQIDKHSLNRNVCRRFGIKFSVEFADTKDGTLQNTTNSPTLSDGYYIHNATRQEDDILGYESERGWFGYNYYDNRFVFTGLGIIDEKFLTNAPTTQYIGENDYCTFAYFNQSDNLIGQNSMLGAPIGSATSTRQLVKKIVIKFYTSVSVQTGSTITYGNATGNGSQTWLSARAQAQIQYTGVGTGNIKGTTATVPSDWAYYTVIAYDDADEQISQTYYFYKQEVCKGFEKFRLTWLNRFGVWDYFNFTKKNVRKVNSKKETYQQIKGNWNEEKYSKHGYKGGTRVFSTNSKEDITLQTDFITEETAEWLEELFTSPDVFVLQERSTDTLQFTFNPSSSVYQVQNKYVQPCIVTSKSYTRKTTANDKLKQYTVQIEMSHNKVIQKA